MSENRNLTSRSYWDGMHDLKEEKYFYPRPGYYMLDCELDRIFSRHLSPLAGQTMIEVGCGSSVWLPYFAKKFRLRITGIDYSEQGIENARSILGRNGVQGELIQADLFLQSASGQPRSSALFSLGLVEHFSDTQAILAALARFLNPDGLIISWLPNIRGRILRWSCRLNPGLDDVYKNLDLDELTECHRRCGLQIVEAIYTQFMDLTLINLSRYSRRKQKWIARLFRLVSLPLVWIGRASGFFLRSPAWCSGMVVVARKTDPLR